MNKTLSATILISMFLLSMFAAPVLAGGNNNPNKIWGAPNFVLNILGKKADWNGNPGDSTDRHTIFVPETTVPGSGIWNGTAIETNQTMWITNGSEFAVLDCNAFDEDGDVDLQLGEGKYMAFVVALGKPGGGADIRGWVYNETSNEYLFMTGYVSVPGHGKRPVWVDATGLLFVSDAEDPYDIVSGNDLWIFDYLKLLEAGFPIGEYAYLWDLDINGCKHLQVRFYKIA
jgi:hypothetical protein